MRQRNRQQRQSEHSNTIKHPDDWKTGDQPMTRAERSYLHTVADEAGARSATSEAEAAG
jgi:hypothetical protein